MQLVITLTGTGRCVYGEEIDLHSLGSLAIARGSHVEPDSEGRWFADLSPAAGPVLGPFDKRTLALDAESKWLEANWLLGNARLRHARLSRATPTELTPADQ